MLRVLPHQVTQHSMQMTMTLRVPSSNVMPDKQASKLACVQQIRYLSYLCTAVVVLGMLVSQPLNMTFVADTLMPAILDLHIPNCGLESIVVRNMHINVDHGIQITLA